MEDGPEKKGHGGQEDPARQDAGRAARVAASGATYTEDNGSVFRGGKVVLAAALPAELASIKRLGGFSRARFGDTRYFEGVIRGTDVALFVSGVGRRNAYETAKAACRALRPSAYISVGFSAALSEALKPGDVVVGVKTARSTEGETFEYRSDRRLAGLAMKLFKGADGCVMGALSTADAVAVTPEAKRRIAGLSGALALDMESAGAAEASAEEGVPFLAVRAISDALDERLPVDFNRFIKAGSMDWPRFLFHIMTHPTGLPGLVRLGRNSKLAAQNLARALQKLLSPSGQAGP